MEEAMRLGIAAGTAAVLTPGTELCHRREVDILFPRVKVQETVAEPAISRRSRMPTPGAGAPAALGRLPAAALGDLRCRSASSTGARLAASLDAIDAARLSGIDAAPSSSPTTPALTSNAPGRRHRRSTPATSTSAAASPASSAAAPSNASSTWAAAASPLLHRRRTSLRVAERLAEGVAVTNNLYSSDLIAFPVTGRRSRRD